MKFVFSGLSQPIEFEENIINSLIIENQKLLYLLIDDIHNQLNGYDGDCVLSQNDIPLEISKNIELITSFIPFEINKKSLLNKIVLRLEKNSLNESNFIRTSQLMFDIERFVEDIAFEFLCDIECTSITPSAIFKSIGLKVSENYERPIEKILDYMELVREFDGDKLFVFVNMRSFFEDNEIEEFFDSAILHKYNVLLIESMEHKRLKNEKRLIVDEDLCEI